MVYFDTSYLVRIYIDDEGFDLVRSLLDTSPIASSFHGEIETIAAFHRVYREKRITRNHYLQLRNQFQDDSQAGAYAWLSAVRELVPKLAEVYQNA
jgi:predicted nucleic acid-binding protein